MVLIDLATYNGNIIEPFNIIEISAYINSLSWTNHSMESRSGLGLLSCAPHLPYYSLMRICMKYRKFRFPYISSNRTMSHTGPSTFTRAKQQIIRPTPYRQILIKSDTLPAQRPTVVKKRPKRWRLNWKSNNKSIPKTPPVLKINNCNAGTKPAITDWLGTFQKL